MNSPVIILHNIRSAHNVGSILRSAACFGSPVVYCTGFTPYPVQADDDRLPHEQRRVTKEIAKTALGAEKTLKLHGNQDIENVVTQLRNDGYGIIACEQSPDSITLADWKASGKTAVVFGNEPHGIDPSAMALTDSCVEIPMTGAKESLNVSIAAAIFLYVWLGV